MQILQSCKKCFKLSNKYLKSIYSDFRLDRNDRYFNDTWEALPANGYTNIYKNLILKDPKITVRLDLDYFKVQQHPAVKTEK